jgi:hypothetical protein
MPDHLGIETMNASSVRGKNEDNDTLSGVFKLSNFDQIVKIS